MKKHSERALQEEVNVIYEARGLRLDQIEAKEMISKVGKWVIRRNKQIVKRHVDMEELARMHKSDSKNGAMNYYDGVPLDE